MEKLNQQNNQRFASFIPRAFAHRVREFGLPTVGKVRRFLGAAMFVDISGFTQMSEELAKYGDEGGEYLNHLLRQVFDPLIEIVHNNQGSISHFYGDAMAVYFPELDGLLPAMIRAQDCVIDAQYLIQEELGEVSAEPIPGQKIPFLLTIKAGVSYGECAELIVAMNDQGYEYVFFGAAIEAAAVVERSAQKGEIIVDEFALTALGDAYMVDVHPDEMPRAQGEEENLDQTIAYFAPKTIQNRYEQFAVSPISEHRTATSIFVNFDGLRDDDPFKGAQLKAYLVWASKLVNRYLPRNGRINRVLSADKGLQLHIIVGAPVAPHSPLQAMRLAKAFLENPPSFIKSQKIGFSFGTVFAGLIGSEARSEYTILGDTVNLSARLAQKCEPNTILCDEDTAKFIEHKGMALLKVGSVRLKGKSEPIDVFSPEEEVFASSGIQFFYNGVSRPIGREAELDKLEKFFVGALQKQVTSLVIEGPIGVGKSDLLATGTQVWLANDGQGFVVVALQQEVDQIYSPWISLLRGMFALQDVKTADEQVKFLTSAIGNNKKWTSQKIESLFEILNLKPPSSIYRNRYSAENWQQDLFEVAAELLDMLAVDKPLLLIFEDFHWADQATIDLFNYLTEQKFENSVGLIAVVRDGGEGGVKFSSRCERIQLDGFNKEQALEYLRVQLKNDYLPEKLLACFGLDDSAETDVSVTPYYLQESLRFLYSEGVLSKRDDFVVIDVSNLEAEMLPTEVRGLAMARIDRLPQQVRMILMTASVIGVQFEEQMLYGIEERFSSTDIKQILTQMVNLNLIRPFNSATDGTYIFTEALLHETAYQAMSHRRRRQLHSAILKLLEQKIEHNEYKPAVLAHHASQGHQHADAFGYALQAADIAFEKFSNEDAALLYRLALEQAEFGSLDLDPRTSFKITLSLADSEIALGELDQAFKNAENACETAKKAQAWDEIAQATIKLSEIAFRQAKYSSSLNFSGQLIQEFAEKLDPETVAELCVWAGRSSAALGAHKQAIKYLEYGLDEVVKTNNEALEALLYEAIAFINYNQKDLEKCIDNLQRSLAITRQYGRPHELASFLNNLALVQQVIGDYQGAVHTLEEACEYAEQCSPRIFGSVLAARAGSYARLGQYERVEDDLLHSAQIFHSVDNRVNLAETYLQWGYDFLCAIGEWEMAEKRLMQAFELVEDHPGSQSEAILRCHLGLTFTALETQRLSKAEAHLKEISLLIDQNSGLQWWISAESYYRGRFEEARGNLRVAKSFYRRGLKASNDGQNPAYDAVLASHLAQIESESALKSKAYQRCWRALKRGVTHSHMVKCLTQISNHDFDTNHEMQALIKESQLWLTRIK